MNWDDYLMGFARHAALKSKDSTQVGCVIVGPNHDIRASGFNGPPRGVSEDIPERRERPLKYTFACHAEANCISNAARAGVSLDLCYAYVTHFPCSSCAKLLIQVGISRVVVDGQLVQGSHWGEDQTHAATMLNEAGVTVVNQA